MKFPVLVHVCIYINICLIYLPCKSFCWDQQYEVCKKAKFFGQQIIQFPFYTQETTQYCGFPGFELTCVNNEYLLLNTSKYNQYRVNQIFYGKNTLRISIVLNPNRDSCRLAKISNFSSPGDSPFQLHSNASVYLLSNCTAHDAQYSSGNIIDCQPNTYDAYWVLAMKGFDDENPVHCTNFAVTPVSDYSDDDFDYLELMKNGFDIKWTAANCSYCESSGGYCGYQGGAVDKLQCLCPDRPHSSSCPTSSQRKLGIKLGLGTLAVGVVIIAVLLYFYRSKCFFSKCMMLSKAGRKDHNKVEAFLKLHGNLAPKRFRYQDIKKMTESFKYKLGQGGYGGVYKGKLADDRVVAVKILNNTKSDGEEFLNEVAGISRTSHVNVVSLLGFCFEGPKRALVYEFMPKGSLEKFISHGKSSTEQKLEWQTLAKIALGIARGLEYLHRGCSTRTLHFDVKPHNILLDEEFCPKISDFGLAKLCLGKESIISMQDMRGTPGYIAPEVYSRNFEGVSHKSDVYSYGMMILEMVGAKDNINEEANNRSSEKYFPDWIYDHLELNVDQVRADDISDEVEYANTRKMMIIGLWCIQTHPSSRPSMKIVLEMLEQDPETLKIPPMPVLHSLGEPLKTFSTT